MYHTYTIIYARIRGGPQVPSDGEVEGGFGLGQIKGGKANPFLVHLFFLISGISPLRIPDQLDH